MIIHRFINNNYYFLYSDKINNNLSSEYYLVIFSLIKGFTRLTSYDSKELLLSYIEDKSSIQSVL